MKDNRSRFLLRNLQRLCFRITVFICRVAVKIRYERKDQMRAVKLGLINWNARHAFEFDSKCKIIRD